MIIENLVRYLNQNYRYCFLRGKQIFRVLPKIPKDIDILIDKKDFSRLQDYLKRKGFFIFPWSKRYGFFAISFDEQRQIFYKLHIVHKIVYGKFYNFTTDYESIILKTRIKKNNYYVAGKDEIQDRLDYLHSALDKKRALGRFSLIRMKLKLFNLHSIAIILYFLFYKLKYFLSKKGISLCFVGVDGVGKTTIINELEQVLAPFEVKTIYMGGKKSVLPPLKVKGFFLSNIKKILEVYLRFLFRILPNRNKIILFDRYIYDNFYRKNDSLLYRFRKFIINLYFKPDLIFLLVLEPLSLIKERERKLEFPFQRLEYEQNLYKRMKEDFDNIFIINNTDKKNTVHFIIKKLLESLNWRFIYECY